MASGRIVDKEIFDTLPEDLRNLTWSCRTPIYNNGIPIKCNKCPTCKELENYE